MRWGPYSIDNRVRGTLEGKVVTVNERGPTDPGAGVPNQYLRR